MLTVVVTYAIQVSTKTTVVNFSVKQLGLEAQLLGIVVQREKPSLEEQSSELTLKVGRTISWSNERYLVDSGRYPVDDCEHRRTSAKNEQHDGHASLQPFGHVESCGRTHERNNARQHGVAPN